MPIGGFYYIYHNEKWGGFPRPILLQDVASLFLGVIALVGSLELCPQDFEDGFFRDHRVRRELVDVDVIADTLEDRVGDGLILVVELLLHVAEAVLVVGDVGFEELVDLLAVRRIEGDYLIDTTGTDEG